MKKLLISIIIILLLSLTYVVGTKGLKIGSIELKSIQDIKEASQNLDEEFNKTKELSSQTYPTAIEDLDKVVKDLKIAKQQYEAKTANDSNIESNLGVIQIEKYNIEYLWAIIGNYATKNGVKLTLDIKSTNTKDVYNLNFSVEGNYIGITDFIYALEDDDELNFEIYDFKISSEKLTSKSDKTTNTATQNNTATKNNSTSNNNKNTTSSKNTEYGITVYSTFTVQNVGINLNE